MKAETHLKIELTAKEAKMLLVVLEHAGQIDSEHIKVKHFSNVKALAKVITEALCYAASDGHL